MASDRAPSLLAYVGRALLTVAVGLFVHFHAAAFLGRDARDVLGDALWGMMMAWWVGAAWPAGRPTQRGLVAFGVCALLEASQLVHIGALDAARQTLLGRLVLGSGFDARDLAAYAGGVVVALAVERGRRGPHCRSSE